MPIKQVRQTGSKKQGLLARKAKILSKIKYYEKRIEEDLASNASETATSGALDDSSDSEGDIFPFHIENGPTNSQLQAAEKMLCTVVNATQELACLEVIQADVQLMVKAPEIQGECPVTKPGTWKEVSAECKIDLVPFSISFYVHQADGLFGAKSYRSLNILAAKKSQEAEISKSVLSRVTCPSNALEVVRNYSDAYRSRRTTLARLADKYAHTLFMEPMPEGGYRLKCSNLLELSWTLINKKSPLAPFHHSMSFDLEYIDESYLKIIKQAHKQLSDPSIDTDERTLLLAKIINTCLEAGPMQESMESETESVQKVEKRRITIEEEASKPKKTKNSNKNDEIQNNKTVDKNVDDIAVDDQIMAPPKSLPKKTKPKGKENIDQNKKAVKRSTDDENTGSVKKAKTDKSNANDLRQSENDNNKKVNNDDKTKSTKDQNLKNNNTNDLKSSENEKNKAVSELSKKYEKINKDKDKDKTKNHNLKSKLPKSLNNIDKAESKTKNTEEKSIKKNVNAEIKNTNVTQKKKNETERQPSQENPTKKINKDVKSQRVVNEGEAKTKNSESQQVASKDKVSSSANKLKAKESEKRDKTGKEKKDSPKDDQESARTEPKTKNFETQKVVKKFSDSTNVVNAKGSEKNKEAGKEKKSSPKDDQQPFQNNAENTKTSSKKVTKKDNVERVSENHKKINKMPEKSNSNEKTESSQKSNAKSTNEAGKVLNKDVKNNNKIITKIIPTKSNEDEKNKNSKNIVSKEKSKPKNFESKTDKNAQKNNNTDPKKTQNDANKEKASDNKLKTSKETQKPKTQKPKSTELKNIENTQTFDQDKIITSTPIAMNVANKDKQTNNKEIVEKVSKTSNIATKTKEHIANITITKDTNQKDKKVAKIIKNLSHKNPSINKLPKHFTGNTMNVKSGNLGKVLKTSNLSKESDGSKVSKIPKKLPSHENLRKNPLRISPRKLPSTFKSASDSNVKPKLNHITNIPRLKKPELKVK